MHPSEFTGPGGYDPVDPPVFFSLPPILLALFLLIVLLALLAGWFARERFGPRPHDPCKAIYDAIRKAAEAAVKAPHDQVHQQARELRKTLKKYLGGVLALSAPLAAHDRTLELILDGKRPPADETEPDADPESPKAPVGAAPVVLVNAGAVVVTSAASSASSSSSSGAGDEANKGEDHPGPTPPAPKNKEPGLKEQVALLRAELHAFNDHWRHKDDRLEELKRARENLL